MEKVKIGFFDIVMCLRFLSLSIMAKVKIALLCLVVFIGNYAIAQDEDTRSAEEMISQALANPDTVTVLNLSDKNMGDLPGSLAKLKNLKILFLDRNNFYSIPQVVFKFKKLEVLSIQGWGEFDNDTNHRSLKYVISEIGSLTNLEELNLERNTISELPPELVKLKSLKRLYLYENSLCDSAVKIICNLDSLETLDISANDLTSLPLSFSTLKKLKNLLIDNQWAEGCPVGEVVGFPKIICSLSNLEVLSMQGQGIDTIPDEIGNLKKLKWLDLSANSFMKIPESVGNLKELTNFNIGLLCLGNMLPLCDLRFYFPSSICNLQKLKNFNIEGRSIAPKEMERIKECLPKGLFSTDAGLR